MYPEVDPQPSFPQIETDVLASWAERDTFKESIRRRADAEINRRRVLDAAAAEIDSYLGPAAPFEEPYPALVVEVNLERAVEHWKQEQSPFGIVVLGGETAPSYSSRSSWRRHANTLLPLKTSFGVG
jgi:hypothetical protein